MLLVYFHLGLGFFPPLLDHPNLVIYPAIVGSNFRQEFNSGGYRENPKMVSLLKCVSKSESFNDENMFVE